MEKPTQPQPITILTALNGFKVKVGCAEILFTDCGHMLNELGRYLVNPGEIEKEYLEAAEYQQDTFEDSPECAAEPESSRVTRGVSDFIESGPVS